MQLLNQSSHIAYRKSRFSTRLPTGRLYTRSHFWIEEREPNLHRVGLTKFATRMLGDLVEAGMEVKAQATVAVGDIIGWVECLKAASDLFCVVDGSFLGMNAQLNENPEWLTKDPYRKGWLYEVKGTPEPNGISAQGYVEFLDEVIEKMLGESS